MLNGSCAGDRTPLLYIEDNEINTLVVQELLASRPALSLHCAPDVDSGVTLAAQIKPQLILVDMHLPDGDGYLVLDRLRAQAETAETPCIALSADVMPEDIRRAKAAGFQDYWTKPIDFNTVLNSLDAIFPRPAPP